MKTILLSALIFIFLLSCRETKTIKIKSSFSFEVHYLNGDVDTINYVVVSTQHYYADDNVSADENINYDKYYHGLEIRNNKSILIVYRGFRTHIIASDVRYYKCIKEETTLFNN